MCVSDPGRQSFQSIGGYNSGVQFHKRRQLFICTHNEAVSIAAMHISYKDRSPVGIHA